MRSGLLIGFILLVNLFVSGQSLFSHNFTVNDGLPSNTIRCIYKDTKDRMWIGTGAGLCQYDGKEFTILGVRNGLAGESVFSIAEDEKQYLWIGCMKGGISKYDGKTFMNYTTKNGLVSDDVRVVWFSRKFHLLFIGTNDGCSVFDGKSFYSLSAKDTKSPDLYMMGFLEGEDFVYCYPYNHDKYYKFYPSSKKFTPVINLEYPRHNPSTSPLILSNGDTLMGDMRNGIIVQNNGRIKSFGRLGQVFDMKNDQDGNVWIAGWSENSKSVEMPGGLFKYNGKEVIRYSENVGIDDPSVWCLYYDVTSNLLWVGTINSGMYKIPVTAFEWFDKDDFGLNQLNVYSLLNTEDNSLVIGTNGALLYRNENGNMRALNTDRFRNYFSSDPLIYRCIKQDRIGNIYASLSQSSLIRFSPKNKFNQPEIIKIQPGVTQFAFDTHDSIFYSDKWWDGVFHCSISPEVSEPVYWGFRDMGAPPNITKMISVGDTIWYLSQTEGLFCSYNGHIKYFRKEDPTLPKILNDIFIDGMGNIILGSNNGEIIIASYQRTGLKIKHRLQTGNEIVGNTVKFLVVDHTQHLYIGTNLGLNRIDLHKLYNNNQLVVNFYDNEIGYYDHSGKVALCDKRDNIWVGTDYHLLKIDSRKLDGQSGENPSFELTGIDINYQPDSIIDFIQPIKLSHSSNNLIFHFASLNYLNPEQTLYRYKLEGLSNKWSEYSTETKAIFTSLNPGSYKIIIESYNRLDNSKVQKIEFSFSIKHPWYLNIWFITFSIVLIICCIYLIIHLRTNQIKEEEAKKSDFTKQLATIEMRALQSQMNPHFIFNSINSIQGFILKNKIEEARGYLMDFAKLLRLTLENASKEFISLEEELQYVQYYLNLELMRFDQKFKVEILCKEGIDPQNILIPPMIIQPFVENSIRHGLVHRLDDQGLLSIQFEILPDILKCTVKDNGVGRKKSQEIESWKQHTHKPQSTRITQDRINLLNVSSRSNKYQVNIIDLTDDKGEAVGTRIEIILPLLTSL